MMSVVRGGDDDIDPDPLVRGSGGGSRPPSWGGHEFPELCRGDREGSRWAKEKRLFVFLWPVVVGWRLVHLRSGVFGSLCLQIVKSGEVYIFILSDLDGCG